MTVTLLAIDCSTERLALGLQHGGRRWAVDEEGGPRASAAALPLMMGLLAEAGLAMGDVQAIAFGRGPGAFTGLRTACSVAQGLALGSGRPVLAVDSLQIVAQAAWAAAGRPEGLDLWVAMDARMEEVYAGRYRREASGWTVAEPPALYELEALAARWQPLAVAGSAPEAFGDRLDTGGAARLRFETGRAEALLEVAEQAWHRQEAVDAALALPLYLRDKVALTTAEREAKRQAERA